MAARFSLLLLPAIDGLSVSAGLKPVGIVRRLESGLEGLKRRLEAVLEALVRQLEAPGRQLELMATGWRKLSSSSMLENI